jgi:hypothetical protein
MTNRLHDYRFFPATLAAAAALLHGCTTDSGACRPVQHHHHSHHGDAGRGLRFYEQSPSDPEWLVMAGRFHGHLGPWVTVGAMIGRDALQRLHTPGQWEIEVICWMPPEKQRTPFSCILDGLQVTSGATMGKRNIRFDFSPEIVRDDQPVVYVIRRQEGGVATAGLAYRMKHHLVDIMAGISSDRLEAVSRDIAGHDVRELFEIDSLTAEELSGPQQRP